MPSLEELQNLLKWSFEKNSFFQFLPLITVKDQVLCYCSFTKLSFSKISNY